MPTGLWFRDREHPQGGPGGPLLWTGAPERARAGERWGAPLGPTSRRHAGSVWGFPGFCHHCPRCWGQGGPTAPPRSPRGCRSTSLGFALTAASRPRPPQPPTCAQSLSPSSCHPPCTLSPCHSLPRLLSVPEAPHPRDLGMATSPGRQKPCNKTPAPSPGPVHPAFLAWDPVDALVLFRLFNESRLNVAIIRYRKLCLGKGEAGGKAE